MTDKEKRQCRTLLTELKKVLSARTQETISDRIALRDAVCAYLAAEQARGTSVETVIRTVKEILRKTEEGAASAAGKLAKQLVDSCLDFHRATSLRRT